MLRVQSQHEKQRTRYALSLVNRAMQKKSQISKKKIEETSPVDELRRRQWLNVRRRTIEEKEATALTGTSLASKAAMTMIVLRSKDLYQCIKSFKGKSKISRTWQANIITLRSQPLWWLQQQFRNHACMQNLSKTYNMNDIVMGWKCCTDSRFDCAGVKV